MNRKINTIFVDRRVFREKATSRILDRLGGAEPLVVENYTAVKDYVRGTFIDPLEGGKTTLYLTQNPGEKIKKCPGTRNKVCCGYYVINLHTNCPIDCSYCILQNYLNAPYISVYTNVDDYLKEIGGFLERNSMSYYRIGTGELTDSLAIDDITGYSNLLADFIRDYDNAVLELKTKSDRIDNLLKTEAPGNVVVAWSLNPSEVIETDERFSASLNERLDAAFRLAGAGYKVGFHFDPIILYEGWREGYRKTVEALFDRIEDKNIEWISLGALRFEPALRQKILERFGKSKAIKGEFIEGADKKLRYLRKMRIEAYKYLIGLIKNYSKRVYVYLCMEDREMWKRVFKVPSSFWNF